jgi:hypothetical protein
MDVYISNIASCPLAYVYMASIYAHVHGASDDECLCSLTPSFHIYLKTSYL